MTITDGDNHFRIHLGIDPPALETVLHGHKLEDSGHRILPHTDYSVKDEKYVLITPDFGHPSAVFCALDTILSSDDFMWPIHKLRCICPALVNQAAVLDTENPVVPFRFQKRWEWVVG